jgi:predicted ATPase
MVQDMLLKSITLTNFLSFGEESKPLSLLPLNVVIGPNGSGKSNLIEAVDLIRSAPKDLLTPIRDGGGVRDWLWKGSLGRPAAKIDAVVENPKGSTDLRYLLSFKEVAQRFEMLDERIENAQPDFGHGRPYFYYRFQDGHGVLNVKGTERRLHCHRRRKAPAGHCSSAAGCGRP